MQMRSAHIAIEEQVHAVDSKYVVHTIYTIFRSVITTSIQEVVSPLTSSRLQVQSY